MFVEHQNSDNFVNENENLHSDNLNGNQDYDFFDGITSYQDFEVGIY